MAETRLYPIKDYNPELYDKLAGYNTPIIGGIPGINPGFQLINAESGDINLVYNDIPLHSTQNPQEEAINELNRLRPDGSTIVVLMGLSLGYVLKRLFISSKCKIIVYEPDINILNFTLKAVDYSEEVASGRVYLANTPMELGKALEKAYSYKDKVVFSCLPSSKQLYAEQVDKTMNELTKMVPNLESNLATLFKYSASWLIYGMYKFHPAVLEDRPKPDSSITILEGKLKDKAALLVSAGPSLDKTIETIRANRGKFVVFCANVVYKKLVEAGIAPDFIVYLDATAVTYTISDYEHSQTNIIIHSAASPITVKEFKPNRLFTFYCQNDLFSRWVADFCGFSIENYKTKGSVSYLAMIAARNMGCNPIILTGQDLAFTDGELYSSGSFWGNTGKINENGELVESAESKDDLRAQAKFKYAKQSGFVRVKGQNGDPVLTSPEYAGFIKHFEDFAAENLSIKLINCSTGGAMIEGFENAELQEVADLLEPVGLNINEYLQQLTSTEKDPIKENYDRILSEITEFLQTENCLSVVEKGRTASAGLLRELNNRRINPQKVKKLYSETLNCYEELENKLFSRWDFGIGVAFKEITELNAVIKDESAGNDLLIRFARSANNLFTTTHKHLNIFVKNLKPAQEEQKVEEVV